MKIGDRFKTPWVVYEIYEIEEYDVDDPEESYCRVRVIERTGGIGAFIGATWAMRSSRIEELIKNGLFRSLQKHENFTSLYEKLRD